MRKFKRLTLTLALLLTAVGGAWAQGPWDSGECTVTLSNGTLTVSGKGAMANYDNNYDRPWHENRNDITSVVVESGVTTAGQAAFYHFENLTSVTLPEGLTRIGVDAFRYCNNLTSITIPSTVTSIGADAFNCLDGSSKMTDVYLYPDPANLTWVDGDCNDFKGDKATQCHVLAEHLSAYQTKFNGKVNVTFVGDLEPLPTPLTVEWDPATKTGTFKMPASNVELQVEYEPTKVTMAANDNAMGTVEVSAGSKVEWTADTWKGWTQNDKVHTVDDITMTSTQSADIYESTSNYNEGKYLHSLFFFVDQWEDNSTVTFSTTGDPFSRIEFTMIDDYGEYNPNILPNDNWTFSGKSAVWEGEATKSLTLQSCSTSVSKITFFKGDGDIPDGVTVNGNGTFTVAKTATVTLKATPAEGYKFLYWEDDQSNTNPVRKVTIESGMADMTYKAVFAEILYNVTFVEGTDLDEWTATPNTDVKKDTKVDIKYTGAKKVIGVKVEKKEAAAGPVTVTWNNNDITGSGNSFTKDGVTITVGDFIDFNGKNFYGGGTFTTTLGNFTKIEVSGGGCEPSDTGWSGSTWTGNASSVSYSDGIYGYGNGNLKFVFTIEPTN